MHGVPVHCMLKAFHRDEYSGALPATCSSVTYEVLNYVKNGAPETLPIAADITNNEVYYGRLID
jgi:hypothetical protein